MRLINPASKLLVEYESELFLARKSKPLWARRAEADEVVETLEGKIAAKPGDYICRGAHDEKWPQKENKLRETYIASGQVDDGWERFDPRPDSPPVQATQVNEPFQVHAEWGELSGKPGDYVVRSSSNPNDLWIVDQGIFEATYDRV